MARPRISLLERCCEETFRPRHHWPLLASDPDLPVPALAELQRRARASDDKDQRALANELKRRLTTLTDREGHKLRTARQRAEGSHPQRGRRGQATRPLASRDRPGPLETQVEAALAELLQEEVVELTAHERFEYELLLGDVQLLDSIRAQIERDGPMVDGSRGQPRAHPLLHPERALSRELPEQLKKFESSVGRRAASTLSVDEILKRLETPRAPESPGLDADADD